MVQQRKPMTQEQRTKMLAELERDIASRKSSYRGRALSLFPHVCASCAREFSGRQLKELTVHHRDHDHNNNPPDGSNWELLCLYCHDHEHSKLLDAKHITLSSSASPEEPGFASPFEKLESLMGQEKNGN